MPLIDSPTDQLVDAGSPTGLIILNHGDPAFTHSSPHDIDKVEEEFIYLISYLLFAESVVIPSRYFIDSAQMSQVSFWSAPLLEEGLIIPERRDGAESFVDASHQRGVGEIGLRRSEFLDEHTSRTRSFQYTDLSNTYMELLSSDLDNDGSFRRVVPGGLKGGMKQSLDRALEAYRGVEDVTPEAFSRAVGSVNPKLSGIALRWAMARYYTTPLIYDSSNTREIPKRAAQLLQRGRVLDIGFPVFDNAAPVDFARTRIGEITAELPGGGVSEHYEAYCEALMEARQRVPEARTLFSEMRDQAALRDVSGTLTREFAEELNKQLRVRTQTGKAFLLTSSLIGGAAGVAASFVASPGVGFQIGTGLGSAVATGVATKIIDTGVVRHKKRTQAPWLLAVDEMTAQLNS